MPMLASVPQGLPRFLHLRQQFDALSALALDLGRRSAEAYKALGGRWMCAGIRDRRWVDLSKLTPEIGDRLQRAPGTSDDLHPDVVGLSLEIL